MIEPLPEPLTLAQAKSWLPHLDSNRNKYSSGQVMLLGGLQGMEGAAWLAAAAAMRSGAGIVRWIRTLLSEPPAIAPEVVQVSVTSPQGAAVDPSIALKELSRTRALVIGPGTSAQAPASWIVDIVQLAQELRLPIIWDGGALHWIHAGWLAPRAGDCLTPHSGELTQLCSLARHDRQRAATEIAQRWDVTVVAKGPVTFITTPGRTTLVSHAADPGMASAGTGDVLAGLLGGLMAQGLGSHEAAGLAVWLHSEAGHQLAKRMTSYSLTAHDLIQAIPEAFRSLLNEYEPPKPGSCL